jgi:hypothetical protein
MAVGRPVGRYSNEFDRISRDPDIDLLKALFERFFERREELLRVGFVRHVYEDPDQFVVLLLPLMQPGSLDRLRFK